MAASHSDDDDPIFAAPPPVRPRVTLRSRGGEDELPAFVPSLFAFDIGSGKKELLAKMSAQGHRATIRYDLW
jgi:hypothetical protein